MDKKKVIIICSSVFIILLLYIIFNNYIYVGKIENGRVIYSEKIALATYWNKDEKIIEYNNGLDKLDNCVMDTAIYNKLKDNDSIFDTKLKDYLKLDDITEKDSVSINYAINNNLIKDSDTYLDFYLLSCGFKSKSKLLKYTEKTFELMNNDVCRMCTE